MSTGLKFKRVEPIKSKNIPPKQHVYLGGGIDSLQPLTRTVSKPVVAKPTIQEKNVKTNSGIRFPHIVYRGTRTNTAPILNKECCVVIPIFQESLRDYDLASLYQCVNILGKTYDICLAVPESLNTSFYNFHKFQFLRLNPEYFKGRDEYSLLCEEIRFYEAFKDYEYMLIYQTDAWVFKDELHKFCQMGYDYIGAPHATSVKKTVHVGNGGLSLRKIASFIDVIPKIDAEEINTKYKRIIAEDCLFVSLNAGKFKSIAPIKVAQTFSVQGIPKRGESPFGCHAFLKSGWSYWRKYITLPKTMVLKEDKNMGAKICYTAIIGGYDKILTPSVVTPGWKYICFSDKPFENKVWEYRPIPKEIMDLTCNNTRKQRKIKILSHKYLPEHSISIYVDGNILIQTNLDNFIEKNCKDKELSIPKHWQRDCIYDEFNAVIKGKRETPEVCNAIKKHYEEEGFPKHYGLTENNVIIRKNTPKVQEIMERWWEAYKVGSQRDQLTLMYVLWKNRFNVNYLDKHTTRVKRDAPFRWMVSSTHKGM